MLAHFLMFCPLSLWPRFSAYALAVAELVLVRLDHAAQDPSLFYCHLASSVAPPSTKSTWERAFAHRKGSDAGQRHTIDQ